jgi:hypothetical protein
MKRQWREFSFGLVILGLLVTQEGTGCSRSGLKGHVYYVAGNQMPSPDQHRASAPGMKTTLYIYQLTNISQVTRDGYSPYYKTISTALVKKVETKEDGSFKVKLNPGQYSLFVKKGNVFYGNIFDEKNNIYPVTVEKGKWTEESYKADYDAVY